MTTANTYNLLNRLADALPLSSRFEVHHISSPPSSCNAIYCAPPGEDPEKTFCESHFLSVAINPTGNPLQIFALEVLIYTTERLTTLFVSKADSTGYLHCLNLPKDIPSPLKTISTTFLAFLIETRQRSDRRLVLSLFARAQDQYLFPGSVENPRKHVLDDRGLVRWWCQVVDPILRNHSCLEEQTRPAPESADALDDSYASRGYLRVPGCDPHETRGFIPRQSLEPSQPSKWLMADPLRDLGRSLNLPATCLIPRFPDDPKARFVDELDFEIREPFSQTQKSPSKGRFPGRWKSVRSLEQFWEMMAFRQECSSGRLVGFLWGVFTPIGSFGSHGSIKSFNERLKTPAELQNSLIIPTSLQSPDYDPMYMESESPLSPTKRALTPSPMPSQESESSVFLPKAVSSRAKIGKKPPTTGPVPSNERRNAVPPEKNRHYYWPTSSRGEVVLRAKDYQRVNTLLIHLDYSNEEIASKSTKRWINDVAVVGRVENWGHTVEGRKPVHTVIRGGDLSVPMLDTSLLRKKKRRDDDEINGSAELPALVAREELAVNVLSVGLVRKKAKIVKDSGQSL